MPTFSRQPEGKVSNSMITLHQLAYCPVNKRPGANRSSSNSSYVRPGERASIVGDRGDAVQVSKIRNDDGKESGAGEADEADEAIAPDEQD